MKIKTLLGCGMFALLLSCATTPTPTVTMPPFPVEEYEALPKSGTGQVVGQAFLKTVGGDVKFGAGSQVVLTPITSYTRWANQQGEDVSVIGMDPRLADYSKLQQADGSGNFHFLDVPPGEYYVVTQVTWDVVNPGEFGSTYDPQGESIVKEVHVENGQVSRVMLTR